MDDLALLWEQNCLFIFEKRLTVHLSNGMKILIIMFMNTYNLFILILLKPAIENFQSYFFIDENNFIFMTMIYYFF